MRRISILNVIQSSPGEPGAFVVGAHADNPSGNWTTVFRGRYYRDEAGSTQPIYSSPTAPSGYSLVQATTFNVVGNASYSGRYTVYTPPSAMAPTSSSFGAGQTTIRVNEAIASPGSPSDLSSGAITNISTYYLVIAGESPVVVPPGVSLENRSFEIFGRDVTGWGEVLLQNLAKHAQNFAGSTAPTSPFLGQPWYNISNGEFSIWSGSSWNLLNGTVFAPATSYRHTQVSDAATWTITHSLNAASPFIVNASFFVDTGGGVIKPSMPSDVTFVDANTLTASFAGAFSGYALIRL